MAISNFSNSQISCTPSEVRTEIIINSTPHRIWKILTDTKNYPSWNPYIFEIKGGIIPGKFVKFRMKGNPKERKFSAKILDFKNDTSWAWGGGLLFLFKARHYFLLEQIDNDHTRLIQGEYWRGLFGNSYGKGVYKDACENFQKMNKKLKDFVEHK